MARISDPIITRRGDVVPGDKQEQPADGATSTVTFTDGTDINWGDALQHALLRMADDLGQVGTLANRPTAGSNEPVWWLVTNGGVNDKPYLTHNDGSDWSIIGDIVYRNFTTDLASPYNIEYGESLWVQAVGGPVDVNLPTPKGGGFLQVIVVDATNDTTLVRDGSEDIDGDASDLVIGTERAVTLTTDGSNWRTVADTADTTQHEVGVMRKTADQSIGSTGNTTITFDTNPITTLSGMSTSNDEFVPPKDGTYRLEAQVSVDFGSSAQTIVRMRETSGSTTISRSVMGNGSSPTDTHTLSTDRSLTTSDAVELDVETDNLGGASDVGGGAGETHFRALYIGP